jgi:hypothetical protein|tara:strand:- start:299 stop:706 length:408 start_codon:yes stop_codon:yes gene_type:complete
MADESAESLTRVFHKIKTERERIKTEFKKEDKVLEDQQKLIKENLLSFFKEGEITSLTTEAGRVTRSIKTRYWTSDWDEMYKFVLEHNVPEFFSKSLNQSNVKEFLEDNPDIVPKGLNADSEFVLSIYKPTKKGE